ncbi:MAG TPA: hypothetical protein VF184_07490, partial [Phycisphaeraceae bacterium]
MSTPQNIPSRSSWRTGHLARSAAMWACLVGVWGLGALSLSAAEPATEPVAEPATKPAAELELRPPAAAPLGEAIEPSPVVERLLEDPLTSEAEKQRLRLFHGRWESLPAELSLDELAQLALMRYELNSPALQSGQTDALLR